MSGVPVTLDSDDLETLLFATGVVKNVEAALVQARLDEQFKEAQPKLADTIDRVARSWREATRRRDRPELFREPTADELMKLGTLTCRKNCRIELHAGDTNPDHACCQLFWRPLVGIGLAEFGVERSVIHWSSSGEETRGQSTWVRLTLRGAQAAAAEAPHEASR